MSDGGGVTTYFCSINILDGPPLACQRNAISMTFRWWAHDGVIFQGADYFFLSLNQLNDTIFHHIEKFELDYFYILKSILFEVYNCRRKNKMFLDKQIDYYLLYFI